jgi:hypothetical protein
VKHPRLPIEEWLPPAAIGVEGACLGLKAFLAIPEVARPTDPGIRAARHRIRDYCRHLRAQKVRPAPAEADALQQVPLVAREGEAIPGANGGSRLRCALPCHRCVADYSPWLNSR